jgi:predicted nucleotidyltransferase
LSEARRQALETLRRIVLDALAGHDAAVYLFGSMAGGDVRHASDIDVAILPRADLPGSFFAELADAIEESTIPYDVDLLDLRTVDPAFRDKVIRTGVKWRD